MAVPSLTRPHLKSEEEEEEEEVSELKMGRGEWGPELWSRKKAGGPRRKAKLTLIHI